jgi:hypothetical protein
MFIPDPDFYSSRIPDLTTTTKEEGEKICCPTFFVAPNITKNVNYFRFEQVQKIFSDQCTKNYITSFYPKNCHLLSKIQVWDPGTGDLGSRKKPIPDTGSKKAPDPGPGSATLLS